MFSTAAAAQTEGDWREALHAWMATEDIEEAYSAEDMEQLEERAAHRINLNQTTREELEELPFLSARQVEELVAYIDRYSPVRSLNELAMVAGLDWGTRQLLEHFVCVGEERPERTWPAMGDVAKYGKHTLMGTAKIPLYKRRGDENGYLGYRYRHDIRYQFNYNNRIKFGLTGGQDAGEPFFSNRNKAGYDHYSYYFQLRDMGRLAELNAGMYRVQMGMGLLMNTGFHLGKLATLQSLGRSTHTLTAHASRSADNYLHGLAATVRLNRGWKATAFASYRAVDATLNGDGTVRTLVTGGYHRTVAEMDKKNNTHETDLGGSVGWRKGTLYVHANAVYTHFDRRLQPQTTARYRHYYPAGSDFFNVSMDYGYNNERWAVAGETALSGQGALAAIHSLNWRVSGQLSLMALHRYYDKRYTALHARSFSEGTRVQNEHGIYGGAAWQPARAWLVQAYADYAHFGWARYQVSMASDAFDAMLNTRYQKGKWTVDGRYRLHVRQRDNADKTRLVNSMEHRVRLRAERQMLPQLTLRTEADGVAVRKEAGNSRGVMVGEQASWQRGGIRIDGHVAWFHTDDYDSRLYQYERSLLYDFSFPAYYGHGLRYSLMVRADLGRRLTLTAKAAVTDYFDRAAISSGLQEIPQSSMTDLLLQLRYSF